MKSAKSELHKALVKKYEQDKEEAELALLHCYNNPAGIGSIPRVAGKWGRPKNKMAETMSTYVDKIVNAEKCLEFLKKYKKNTN